MLCCVTLSMGYSSMGDICSLRRGGRGHMITMEGEEGAHDHYGGGGGGT